MLNDTQPTGQSCLTPLSHLKNLVIWLLILIGHYDLASMSLVMPRKGPRMFKSCNFLKDVHVKLSQGLSF